MSLYLWIQTLVGCDGKHTERLNLSANQSTFVLLRSPHRFRTKYLTLGEQIVVGHRHLSDLIRQVEDGIIIRSPRGFVSFAKSEVKLVHSRLAAFGLYGHHGDP